MKATQINDISINKAHCEWIYKQAEELKALFSYNSDRMIELNKTRALSSIDTAINSLNELKAYIEQIKD